jgi:hypothetical protein
MKIKPIETIHNGYRFRSRLEARWAVFFDTLGIKYEYEKEGYDFGDGVYYLPDFWLPQVNMWAGVKPEKLTSLEMRKCNLLVDYTKNECLLLIGTPENKPYFATCGIYVDNKFGETVMMKEYYLTMYHRYPHNEGRFYSSPGGDDDSYFNDTEKSANAAKSARFEFNR